MNQKDFMKVEENNDLIETTNYFEQLQLEGDYVEQGEIMFFSLFFKVGISHLNNRTCNAKINSIRLLDFQI